MKEDHYDPISLDLIQQKLSAVLPGGSVTQFATKLPKDETDKICIVIREIVDSRMWWRIAELNR